MCNILALAPRHGMCPHLFLLFFSFVASLVCAAWHVTYLRDSLLTRISSCDACLGAVVLPTQVSVWGRGCSSYSPRWADLGSHLCGRGAFRPCLALACTCAVLSAVAWFTSYLPRAWFHTPLWLPLFVVLLACAAWHVTYLRDCLLTRILSCVACLGAVVHPIQVSVRGRLFFLLHSSLGWSWFTPLLSCTCVHVCALFSTVASTSGLLLRRTRAERSFFIFGALVESERELTPFAADTESQIRKFQPQCTSRRSSLTYTRSCACGADPSTRTRTPLDLLLSDGRTGARCAGQD